MSETIALQHAGEVPRLTRLRARPAVVAARLLMRLPPARLRRVLQFVRRGAEPASYERAALARAAVVAVSARCSGQYCLQRALAAALLCRTRGAWPTVRAGVRGRPVRAHAWIEAEGRAVDEPYPADYFVPVLTVAPLGADDAEPADGTS